MNLLETVVVGGAAAMVASFSRAARDSCLGYHRKPTLFSTLSATLWRWLPPMAQHETNQVATMELPISANTKLLRLELPGRRILLVGA